MRTHQLDRTSRITQQPPINRLAARGKVKAYFDSTPEWFTEKLELIPADKVEPAFGEKRGRDWAEQQRKLVQAFGEGPVSKTAEQWGTSLGSTQPGKNPHRTSEAEVADLKMKVAAADAEKPSQNPWHKNWKSISGGSDKAAHEKARIAAQTSIIRSGTASRYAWPALPESN